MRVLQGGGRPARLGRAIAELGRIAKTLHLLSGIDSEEHRRQSSVGLTRHEGRHSVAQVIFHGNQGELRQPYREGKKTSWARSASRSTRSCSGTPNALTTRSHISEPPVTRSPTKTSNASLRSKYEHIKMLGNFPFTLPADGQRRQLRGLAESSH
jgi:hypothetical protein